MRLIQVTSRRQRAKFVNFIYDLYRDDPGFVDTSVLLTRMFLERSDRFTRESILRVLAVVEGERTLAQCILVFNPGFPCQQLSFFEALPGQDGAVDLLWAEACAEAKRHDAQRIAVGLNGHVSYGVGIMTSGYGRATSFDSLYNKPYYADYFTRRGLEHHTLSTYTIDLQHIDQRYGRQDRAYREFSFRPMEMARFHQEMLLFGDLANRCLHDTFLYFDRDPAQLAELMRGLKWFLRPENLLFVLKDGGEVGFIFWHPDYNEVLTPGRRHSLAGFVLRYLLRRAQISTVKVNAIGVLPHYQKSGAAMGLFMTALRHAGLGYLRGETNFVWDSNEHSRRFNLGMGNQVDRRYAAFVGPVS
ncbi:MAG: hypothetical protein WAS25_05640 [Geothrix sp.]|uniref:hypothetical protein n=1 Tax=Geothrix sp. TaxID=1962974 RepID=UPI003BB16B8F